jgi:uncharacterized protein
MTATILDTWPLVAVLSDRDARHEWATSVFGEMRTQPFLTCEAVLVEATYLLRGPDLADRKVIEMLRLGVLAIPFRMTEHAEEISRLMAKYADIPMSLADACLVRMAEINPGSAILTMDRDFRVYRKNGRQGIPLVVPPGM